MKRRSPLQGSLPRLPGDSIRGQLVELAFNDLLPALMAATLLSIMALIEWQASIHHWSRHPALYCGAALWAIALCVWRFMRAHPRIRALQLGRDGEISVAFLLDSLRGSGARVFHDVPLKVGNIDHVVLSTIGFYAIETKTRSKPLGRRSEISFERDHILVDGFQPDRDPLDQVERNARCLRVLLTEKAKKQFEIKGVVLFPGWWVQRMDAAWRTADRPWVLNPNAFMKWMARGRAAIALSDVHLAATHLEEYIRQKGSASQAAAAL
ncbi:MAG TPA: nuclease-related domain-containing protein [Steroidobacteraceae bacterium]|nr:nuclease-related domain-containing protein [Steroidobacteraceae bacterium]